MCTVNQFNFFIHNLYICLYSFLLNVKTFMTILDINYFKTIYLTDSKYHEQMSQTYKRNINVRKSPHLFDMEDIVGTVYCIRILITMFAWFRE